MSALVAALKSMTSPLHNPKRKERSAKTSSISRRLSMMAKCVGPAPLSFVPMSNLGMYSLTWLSWFPLVALASLCCAVQRKNPTCGNLVSALPKLVGFKAPPQLAVAIVLIRINKSNDAEEEEALDSRLVDKLYHTPKSKTSDLVTSKSYYGWRVDEIWPAGCYACVAVDRGSCLPFCRF